MTDQLHVGEAGDLCWLVEVGVDASAATSGRVHALRRALEQARPAWLVEMVPGYCTLGMILRPPGVSREEVEAVLATCARNMQEEVTTVARTITIPVHYGDADGPDMETVCRRSGLGEQEVVRRHAAGDYRCAMVGFLPGFPYLLGLDPHLTTPRLEMPRTTVPAGSVGIAGEQTGVYPVTSPGGWNIIGRTPLTLFDPLRAQPSLVLPGDTVRFAPISREELKRQETAAPPRSVPPIAGYCEGSGCEVVESGMLTTIQDGGRWGWQHLGVPVSGAADRHLLAIGNLLVGNEEGAAALEILLSGPTLAFAQDALVALVGADACLKVDGREYPAWTAVLVRSGSIVSAAQPMSHGCRAWLCIAGGVNVLPVMGSRSTLLHSVLPDLAGRALRAGDRLPLLPLGNEARRVEGFSCPSGLRPSTALDEPVPVLPGPQLDSLAPAGHQAFLDATWTMSADSDRMGMRLEGPRLTLTGRADVISEVIPEGAVEVTGSGLPIVMLADRQTTGGYVKPFVVVSAALGKVAQLLPGDTLRFRLSTHEETRQLVAAQTAARETLAHLRQAWRSQRPGGRMQVVVDGTSQTVQWQEVTPLEVDDEQHG